MVIRIGRGFIRNAVLSFFVSLAAAAAAAQPSGAPTPLVDANHPAEWVFAFKFNAAAFPTTGQLASCAFDQGHPKSYVSSQHYVVAQSGHDQLADGAGLLGTSTADPVGATFDEIYRGNLSFLVWNDQFYLHPKIAGCGQSCSAPWGHSKGVIAWDDAGNGLILQVSTPSWPGSGTRSAPRADDGNTLGCVDDDDVKVSQHFFALKLSPSDTLAVLTALANASVVTDLKNPQLARIGGPADIRAQALLLGRRSASTQVVDTLLSSGIRLISKPSALHVPPWQLVSARLGAVPLRAATWWTAPSIPTTTAGERIGCWTPSLGTPGPVEIATSGQWEGKTFSLRGGGGTDRNHAEIGVSTAGVHSYVIFGDMNQQGSLNSKCASSQNGRGGLFFVLDDAPLHDSVARLIAGGTAPAQ